MPGSYLILKKYAAVGRLFRCSRIQPLFDRWRRAVSVITARIDFLLAHSKETLVVQRFVRATKRRDRARRHRRQMLDFYLHATFVLQRASRSFLFRMRLFRARKLESCNLRERSCLVIQTYWRGFVGRCRVRKMPCHILSAVIRSVGGGSLASGVNRLCTGFEGVSLNLHGGILLESTDLFAMSLHPGKPLKTLPLQSVLRGCSAEILDWAAHRRALAKRQQSAWRREHEKFVALSKKNELERSIESHRAYVTRKMA